MGGSLKLPAPETPDETQYSLPFTFVADEAFPLLGNLLNLTHKEDYLEEKVFLTLG
jgi:hypothetical protein